MTTINLRECPQVEAQQLQPGYYLPATKCTVIAVYAAHQVGLPVGKVELIVTDRNGIKRRKVWGKYTKISYLPLCKGSE